MATILSFEKQQEIKPLSRHARPEFEILAREIESKELREIAGGDLIDWVKANPTNEDVVKLLTGDDGAHAGLYSVEAYLVHGAHALTSQHKETFEGYTDKNIEYSERTKYGALKNINHRDRELALFYWSEVEAWAKTNENVAAHLASCETGKTVPKTPKITKV